MRRILSLVAALAAAVCFTLVAPQPAQAVWSDNNCQLDNGSAAMVCVMVYTIPHNNGLYVQQVRICGYKKPQLYYNGFQGTHDNTIEFWGSAGNFLGFKNLNDSGASLGGSCTLTNINNFALGKGACWDAYGTKTLAASPDVHWQVSGGILNGATC